MGRPSKKKLKEYEKLETENTKICSVCGKIKLLFEFPVNSRGRKMCNTSCMECERERQYKRHYGISLKEYEELLEQQGKKCIICGATEPGGKHKTFFLVDHDHITSKIRGLLCHDCNIGLGAFRDNPEFLVAAAAYLLQHKDKK